MLSRRRRRLGVTAGAALAFAAGAGLLVWKVTRPAQAYRPGEAIEGLTAELARSLPPDYPRVTYRDVTAEAGIRFTHFGGTRSSQIVEDMGSGAAWGDYDNDGWEDLFVVNASGPVTWPEARHRASPARSTLYRNNGDGTFTDVTERAGIDHRRIGMAAAWGDYDNDGHLDLLVTGYGENALYRNNGDGTFTDRTRETGLGGRPGFWTAAAWADYDRDGHLDLYVTGYVQFVLRPPTTQAGEVNIEEPPSINPSSFAPARNLLFRNTGRGTFTEVAARTGVVDSLGRGLAASWVDLDEDGWLDLYVGNDVSDNVLYRNLGGGRFQDISHAARVADYRSAMGVAVGDWDNDGDQDMVVTHWIAQENALYNNRLSQLRAANPGTTPPLQFMDEADRYGLGQIALDFIGWGAAFLDYDNDGRLDLFVVNGSTFQRRSDPTRLVPMRDQLFWNRGPEEGFFDVSAVSGPYFGEEHVGRGAAFADYDRDGDLDAVVVNHGGPLVLLRNEGGNRGAWLQVAVRGTRSHRQGIGVKLRLVAGGTTQVRQVGVQPSYLSQNSLIEHFGLGRLDLIDTLAVTWPGGTTEIHTGLRPNTRVLVVEGAARPEVIASGSTPAEAAVPPGADDRQRVLDFWAALRSATAHRTAGRIAEAAADYERAVALDPRHEDALYYLGNMRFELGEFGRAEEAWRRLVAVNPVSARGHLQLGTVYLCADSGAPFNPATAAAEFRRAHDINREETGSLLRLGEAALYLNDAAEARRQFTAVVGSHRDSPVAHFYLGYLDWSAGRQARAREAFRVAVEGERATPPPAGATGEGDTRRGTAALLAERRRCTALADLSSGLRGIAPADLEREMTDRYRALDLILREGRRRAR